MTTTAITKDDLESKLREIEIVVDEAARDWSKWIIGASVVATVAVIGWRVYRARNQRITVEVYTSP